MNNENLIPSSKRSQEQRVEIARKGGIKSGEAKRKRKAMKEQLKLLLELPLKNEKLKNKLKELGIEDNDINNQMAMTVSLLNEAINGNIKAYEIIRDTIGEKPIEKQEVKQIETKWFKEDEKIK